MVTIAPDQQEVFEDYVARFLDDRNLPSPATVRRARSVHLEWDGSELHIDSQLWASSQRIFQKVTFIEEQAPFDVEFTIQPHALDVLLPR